MSLEEQIEGIKQEVDALIKQVVEVNS